MENRQRGLSLTAGLSAFGGFTDSDDVSVAPRIGKNMLETLSSLNAFSKDFAEEGGRSS